MNIVMVTRLCHVAPCTVKENLLANHCTSFVLNSDELVFVQELIVSLNFKLYTQWHFDLKEPIMSVEPEFIIQWYSNHEVCHVANVNNPCYLWSDLKIVYVALMSTIADKYRI